MFWRFSVVCLLGGCTAEPELKPLDVCDVEPRVMAGISEIGLGASFSPITDGQDATVEQGAQHLWTFVVNTRVIHMDVGQGDLAAAVYFTARDESGVAVSLDVGCRAREFAETADGAWQLASEYTLSLYPNVVHDGATVTLQVEVLDREGRRATGEHDVVARYP